jgi:TonB family protein
VAAEAPKKRAASGEDTTTPVNILEKPRPEYTAEGRSLKIEGDVVLEMVFLANGSIQINRVINGLGHGLDEAAIRAAQQIKFKPAKRDGQAVDFPARVRIEFRLAY